MSEQEYDQLVVERNKMRYVMDNGRRGTSYHRQATDKYSAIVKKISQSFKDKHNARPRANS